VDRFDAGPDSDPNFHFDDDPDLDPDRHQNNADPHSRYGSYAKFNTCWKSDIVQSLHLQQGQSTFY
jgi:hypothetical protein